MMQQKQRWMMYGFALMACVTLIGNRGLAATTSPPGDVNGDGITNFADASILASNYGLSEGATLGHGDVNGDGAVNFSDSFTLNANLVGSYATTSGTVGDSITSFIYNSATGVMTIETTSAQLSGVNLTTVAPTLFNTNVAAWLGPPAADYTFVSNTTTQQGFTTLAAFGDTFFPGNGYVIGGILPAGIPQATLLANLTLGYSVVGVAGTQVGDLIYQGAGPALNDTVITAPASVAFGRQMLNATPSTTLTLNKTGVESTTYSATPSNNGVAVSASGSFAGGAQVENASVQLQNNANGSGATGVKAYTVTVDNLAATSAAAGQGSADPDDVVNVSATVVNNRVVTATGVNLGSVIVGATTASVNTNLSTSGDDNNFTRITVGGGTTNGSASVAAGSQLFNDAADSLVLGVTGNFATAGAKAGSVGLTVTGEGLTGESPVPVNVAYTANAFDPSDAQFGSNSGTTLILNFGNKVQNTGSYNLAESIANALATLGFTAELDFDSVLSSTGDTSVLFTNLTNNAFSGLAGGSTFGFTSTFDTNNALGPYSAVYQFGLSDSDSYQGAGSPNSQVLTLTLQGNITPIPEPSTGLLLLLGALALLARRRGRS